jgi:hypothetical protein
VNGFEVEAVLESGVSLTSGKPWRGHRIRYRKEGERFYRSFLLSVDDDALPTDAMIEAAVLAHYEQARTK